MIGSWYTRPLSHAIPELLEVDRLDDDTGDHVVGE
jgi:hypothetical protein